MTQDASELDTSARSLKLWLQKRLRHGKRDAIDVLAKHIIPDTRLPGKVSRSMLLARMKQYGYSAAEMETMAQAWREMYLEQESE